MKVVPGHTTTPLMHSTSIVIECSGLFQRTGEAHIIPSIADKHRLLIFEVKEGWEPLCKFLGKPVPDVPFPKVRMSAFDKMQD